MPLITPHPVQGQHNDVFYHLNIPMYYKKVATASAPAIHAVEKVIPMLKKKIAPAVKHEHIWILDKRNVSRDVTSLLFAGLILATVTLEKIFHKLEHLSKNSVPRQTFLYSVKMELVGLGFISFLLLFIVDILSIEGEIFERFEFAHMWMFIFGMSRLVNAIVGYVTILNMEKEMFVSESHDSEMLIHSNYQPRPMFITLLVGEGKTGSALQYQILKYLFLSKYKLSSFSFNFAMYIREATSNSIVERVKEPRNMHWFLLICIAFLYIAVIEGVKDSKHQDLGFSCLCCYLNFLLSFSLMFMADKAAILFIARNTKSGSILENWPRVLKSLKEKEEYDSQRGLRNHGLHATKHAEKHHALHGTTDAVHLAMTTEQGKTTRHAPRQSVFDKDDEHPFAYGMSAELVLFLHDLVVMIQSFQFGYFVCINSRSSMKLMSPKHGILYNIFTIIPHLLIMFWSGPRTVLAVNEIHATAIPDMHAFHTVKEKIEELNVVRDRIRKAIKKKFPDRTIDEIVAAIWDQKLSGRDVGQFKELTKIDVKSLMLQTLGIKLNTRQCQLIITSMDNDMSGTIDKDEFIEFVDFSNTKELPVLRTKLATALREKFPSSDYHQELKQAWNVALGNTTDSDGELSPRKMKAFFKDFLLLDISVGKCDLIVSSMDADHSGTISKQEFYDFLGLSMTNSPIVAHKKIDTTAHKKIDTAVIVDNLKRVLDDPEDPMKNSPIKAVSNIKKGAHVRNDSFEN